MQRSLISSARADRIALSVAVAATAGFLLVFASRKVSIFSDAPYDDLLFAWEGLKIASGSWLGRYTTRTLIKGAGFPAFLAFGHFSGLSYPVALGAFMATCCGYFSFVTWRIWSSLRIACATYAALLFTPAMFVLLRITRDTFYAGVTIALFAASLHLLFGGPRRPSRIAVLLGSIGGLFWLTREEGIWIVPALGLLAGASAWQAWRKESWPGVHRSVATPIGKSLIVFAIALSTVGLLNLMAYGQMTLNEVKGGPFQSAMVALQRASYPNWRAYVPVPKESRARIYDVSPTFRSLKPYLDDEHTPSWAHEATCTNMPELCGDIAGGWFLWSIREAAAKTGAHASASAASAFYRQLAAEVNEACQDGRLTCAPFMLPFVPPMTAKQIPHVLESAAQALRTVVGASRISTRAVASTVHPGYFDLMLHILNHPPAAGVTPDFVVELQGIVSGPDAASVTATAGRNARIVEAQGLAAAASSKAPSGPRRFKLTIACFALQCEGSLRSGGSTIATLDLRPGRIQPGSLPASGGYDLAVSRYERVSYKTARDNIADAFLRTIPTLQIGFVVLNAVGAAAFFGLLVFAVVRRQGSTYLVVAAALFAAIVTRILLIALVDASSFPAVNATYLLPATLLTVAFSVIAIAGFVEEVGSFRRSRSPGSPPPLDGNVPS